MPVSSIRWLPCCLGLLGVAAGERDDIGVANQGPPAFQVGDDERPAPGHQRQVHRRSLAGRLRLGLVEVGMAVDEEQPGTPAPARRQGASEQDRAVATEHHRERAGREQRLDRIGERNRVVPEALGIEQAALRIAPSVVGGRLDQPRAARAEPFRKARLKQSPGHPLDASREEPENGWSLDDREFVHQLCLLRMRPSWSGGRGR